jgi:hypothetical protein
MTDGTCTLRTILFVFVAWFTWTAAAQASNADLRFIRIGTGAIGGTYFPVGGLIANAVSKAPGSRDCAVGGSCGVPGLIATVLSTQGSIENVTGIGAGTLELALAQSDVLYFAYTGKGVFAGKPPMTNLRVIANLFPEAVHLVVRRDSGITSVEGLKGRRVSIGEPESGTRVVAEMILKGYRLGRREITESFVSVGKAGDQLAAGNLDAYFMVGGPPIEAIVHTAATVGINLLPIFGPPAERIRNVHPFMTTMLIPEGLYSGVTSTQTLGVAAQLVASAELDSELVYGITRALWQPNNRKVLDAGHPNGKVIQLSTALDGLLIPLHPGAARFYAEAGMTAPEGAR